MRIGALARGLLAFYCLPSTHRADVGAVRNRPDNVAALVAVVVEKLAHDADFTGVRNKFQGGLIRDKRTSVDDLG